MEYTYAPMDVVKRRHHGSWFDPGWMGYFHTRLPREAIILADGRALFVTSEQYAPIYLPPHHEPRRYSIRVQSANGTDIKTLGEFQAYATRAQARRAMLAYAKEQ